MQQVLLCRAPVLQVHLPPGSCNSQPLLPVLPGWAAGPQQAALGSFSQEDQPSEVGVGWLSKL